MSITLASLIYYPIKACRGFEIESANVERMGLQADRRMMVVTPAGECLTQREYPKLALVLPQLEDGALTLSAPEMDVLSHVVQTTGETRRVNIWESKGVAAIDQGEVVAGWFSEWLGAKVRLIHIAAGIQRLVNEPDYTVRADDHTGFADGYPILLISEESLQELNEKLETPVPMNRFRPNVVVKGCAPSAEDGWNKIKIGDVELAVVKPCARCVVTTIDKETLEQSKEPLKTLAKYRKHELGAIFGQNVIPLNGGRLQLGMTVEVL
ncbi:MAG: MOSC N-terminal beta barrel domain-containing protein [Chloroflexota bacterium]